MMPGQVQQGGKKEREQARRCFTSSISALCLRKQVWKACPFSIAAMQLLHSSISARQVFLLPLAIGHDLFDHEIAEGRDPLGVAQLFGIGKENRHLATFNVW